MIFTVKRLRLGVLEKNRREFSLHDSFNAKKQSIQKKKKQFENRTAISNIFAPKPHNFCSNFNQNNRMYRSTAATLYNEPTITC